MLMLFSVAVAQLARSKKLFEVLKPQFWFVHGLAFIGGFAASNPFAVVEPTRFLADFKTNILNYEAGLAGGTSDFGIGMYAQYVLFTSFGVLGAFVILIGVWRSLNWDRWKAWLLFVTPLIFIFLLGRYRTNLARNMTATLPYLFLLQGLGFSFLLEKYNLTKGRSKRYLALLIFLILVEPLAKTTAQVYTNFLPDSRVAAEHWIRQQIPLGSTIGWGKGGWGNPVDPNHFEIIPMAFGEEWLQPKCLDYYVIDQWFQDSYGPGKSMYLEPIYSNIHFINSTGFYPFEIPHDPKTRNQEFLKKFDLLKEFSNGFYGPAVRIYKSKQSCTVAS